MDPSVPVQRALAIAGERVAGGIGTHETALASPDVVDLGGRCVLPGFTDAHVHFPTWALALRQVRLEGTTSLDEALDRVRGADAPGGVLRGFGWRDAEWATPPTKEALDAVTGDTPAALFAHDYHSLWLNSPALALAGGDLDVHGGRGRAGRRRRADGDPPRGVRLALPRPASRRSRRRVRGGDARGTARSKRPRRDGRTRQGRLARRCALLAATARRGRADAAGVAVAAARASRSCRRGRPASRARRLVPPSGLSQGLHGRDAGLADGADARRLGRGDHERR